MGTCSTVSTEIPAELKARMEKLKIDPSKILRKAIEDEVKKREKEKRRLEMEKLKPILNKVSLEKALKSVRGEKITQMKYFYETQRKA